MLTGFRIDDSFCCSQWGVSVISHRDSPRGRFHGPTKDADKKEKAIQKVSTDQEIHRHGQKN